jgi:hypothetical protein
MPSDETSVQLVKLVGSEVEDTPMLEQQAESVPEVDVSEVVASIRRKSACSMMRVQAECSLFSHSHD